MKKLFILALLFAASCTSVEEPAPAEGQILIKIQAEYADGTTEHSSLIVVK